MSALILYATLAASLAYLIYRYMRYSRWEETDVGRAFLVMKMCLFTVAVYGTWVQVFPHSAFRDAIRAVLLGSVLLAVLYQTRVLIRRQGGFRRNRDYGEPR